ncbi:MAG: hypothetical protein JKY65_17665 [Planctomycetes bacterium]|nr:hypothetical protein [Planctomycetota bacterium]
MSSATAADPILAPGDRLLIQSRLRVRQGELGALEKGVSAEERTRSLLVVSATATGGEVEGVVRSLPGPWPKPSLPQPSALRGGQPQSKAAAPKALAYRGRPTDLVWLSAPRLLGPLAKDVRQGRLGERTVTLVVAGYPVDLKLTIAASKTGTQKTSPAGCRQLTIRGEGASLIGETGVTLRLRVRARLELRGAGQSRLDLKLKWTATGGPGVDAEAQVHLETLVVRVSGSERGPK